MTQFRQQVLFIGLLFAIVSDAISLQSHMLLNSDISWLILAAKRFTQGGTYVTNFFEINPPMSIYLYIPVVVAEKFITFSQDIVLRVYVFLVAAASLGICFRLTQKLFSTQHNLQRIFFNLTLAAIFLILPAKEFGQREHFTVVLFTPYLLLISLRLQNQTLSNWLIMLIGLMAGIGVAIKPYFLLGFILQEIHYLWIKRHFSAVLRLETIMIGFTLIIYAWLIIRFNQDYLTTILPFAIKNYYQRYKLPFKYIINSDAAWFGYYSLVFYWLSFKDNPYKPLCTVLMIASVGFFLSFAMQQTLWYYHLIPMLSTYLLLDVLLFSFLPTTQFRLNYAVFLLSGIVYILFRMNYVWLAILLYPAAFFALFAILFARLFFYSRPQAIMSNLAKLTIILAISLLFYTCVKHTYLHNHVFLLTLVLLISLFLLLIPATTNHAKLVYLFDVLFGMTVFAFPFYLMGHEHWLAKQYSMFYAKFIADFKQFSHKKVYYMSNSAEFAFPGIDYLEQNFTSRFSFIGWLPATVDQQNLPQLNYFISALADDIDTYQPDYIFVDVRRHNKKTGYFGNDQIDYIHFFAFNAKFSREWQHYQYKTTLDSQPFYKFAIYQRS